VFNEACARVLVGLAAASLPLVHGACPFDQTRIPALPDDVLYFGQVPDTGRDSGGGGGTDCRRSEPAPGDFGTSDGVLAGTWARRLLLKTERDTRNSGDWKDSSWTVYERVAILHHGARLREVTEVCGIAMGVIDGAQTGFPDALLKSLPVLAQEGDFLSGGEGPGAAYASPAPFVRLLGLQPEAAAKEWAECRSYFDASKLAEQCPLALWPEVYDMDCDGNPGVSLDMTVGAAATEQVYMVQRDVMSRSGTVRSADRIDGTMTLDQRNANLGSTKAMLKSNPPSRGVEGGSAFVMVRVAANADCTAVTGAAFDE
jgi:hypothetical protein